MAYITRFSGIVLSDGTGGGDEIPGLTRDMCKTGGIEKYVALWIQCVAEKSSSPYSKQIAQIVVGC
jgi:hypothetical protein